MSARLALADPPYLGRANRWYGSGRGTAGGRHVADRHPEAAVWDDPSTHHALIERLSNEFDGWALAGSAATLATILPMCPPDVRVMVWHVTNAPPSGSRLAGRWEPVIIRVPSGRRAHGTGSATADVLTAAAPRRNFAGSKPDAWTHWVLDALGYTAGDTVHDLFPGSGAVTRAALCLPLAGQTA